MTNPMEPTDQTPHVSQKKKAPWGALIGLVLILAIIVAGAYYAFTERTHQNAPSSASY